MDRVQPSEGWGRTFESCRARQPFFIRKSPRVRSPGNYTKGLGTPVGVAADTFEPWGSCQASAASPWCGTAVGTAYAFPAGSRIYRLSSHTYYVANNPAGEQALYRETLGSASGNAAGVAEEVAEGIQNMQLSYGIDTSAIADQAVDGYVTAADVTDWSRVLSVRVALLMVTKRGDRITTAPQAYTFNGATTTPTGYRLRKAFTTVIAIRDRL
jgi:type IV pilus assembly protein PilW